MSHWDALPTYRKMLTLEHALNRARAEKLVLPVCYEDMAKALGVSTEGVAFQRKVKADSREPSPLPPR